MNNTAFIFITCLTCTLSAFAQNAFTPIQLVAHINNGIPVTTHLPVTTLEEAYNYQSNLVHLLRRSRGELAGYKAALVTEAAQQKFRTDRPVLGVVMKNMLLRDRTSLDQDFALRPLIEADLMVLVKSESINTAETHEEVLAALEGVHPLIELPDLTFAQGVNILPLWITAINAGANAAVVGDPVIVTLSTNLIERLGSIRATIMDKRGKALASGTSDQLMGHPLNVVLWIRDEVLSRGGKLKKGDVLWLGSLTPPLPVTPGESYQVLYSGLDVHPVSMQVNIRKKVVRNDTRAGSGDPSSIP